jgi:hypothetical protein
MDKTVHKKVGVLENWKKCVCILLQRLQQLEWIEESEIPYLYKCVLGP